MITLERVSPIGDMLSADLRVWLGEWGLLDLTLAATQTASLSQQSFKSGDQAYSPRTMLRLLTYCYAAGTYGSEQVAEMAHTDPVMRSLWGGASPDCSSIRQFRRENRATVQHCLAQVLRSAWLVSPPTCAHDVQDQTGSNVNNRIADAARKRVRQAMFLDAIAADI